MAPGPWLPPQVLSGLQLRTIFSPGSVRFSSCPGPAVAPPVRLALPGAICAFDRPARVGAGLPGVRARGRVCPGAVRCVREAAAPCPGPPPVLPCPAPRRIPIKPQTITHRWAVLDKRLHYFWLPLPWGSWKPGIQGSHSRALFKQVLLIELRGEKETRWNLRWGGERGCVGRASRCFPQPGGRDGGLLAVGSRSLSPVAAVELCVSLWVRAGPP